MKNRAVPCKLASVLTAGALLSQCALKDEWSKSAVSPAEPIQVVPLPSGAVAPLPAAPKPYVSKMPVVKPIEGRLLSESTFEINGRKFLQQRIVIREVPLETEQRITQID